MRNIQIKVAFGVTMALLCFFENTYAQSTATPDTITIKFGNQSKIIMHVSDSEDLEELLNYDFNGMLQDLKIKMESSEGSTDYIKIEDTEGARYLKDTVQLQAETPETDERELTEEEEKDEKQDRSLVIEAPGIKSKDRSKSKHSFNVEVVLNNYLKDGDLSGTSSETYAVKPFGSWYIALTSKRKFKISGPLYVELGGGVSWYNFKMEDPQVMILKGSDNILFEEAPNSIDGQKSKLTASFVNISFVPLLDFSQGKRKKSLSFSEGPVKITKYNKQGFRIGVGPYAGYRLASHTKFKFSSTEEEGTQKDKERGSFYLNNFRYGVRFQIGYKGLDLFANYDLNPLFESNHGPKLNAFSFGIIL